MDINTKMKETLTIKYLLTVTKCIIMEQDLCLSLCVCLFTQIFEKQVLYIKSKFLPYYLTILLFYICPQHNSP